MESWEFNNDNDVKQFYNIIEEHFLDSVVTVALSTIYLTCL